jgi:Flp pilus assembly protein TadD
LTPWIDADLPPSAVEAGEAREALQALWLRACHHSGQLQNAWAWIGKQDAAGLLGAAARGVASLIAFDLEHLDAARSLADAALAADGEQLEALVARGSVALAEGDAAHASQLFQRALHRHPGDGRTWSALGFASLLRQNFSSARTQLERAVETLPDDVETWQALGWSRLLQGDRDGAVAAFHAALAIDPADADSHGALALLHALLGDAVAAHKHFDGTGKLGADGVALRYARAVLSGEARDPAVLEAMAREALSQWRPRP